MRRALASQAPPPPSPAPPASPPSSPDGAVPGKSADRPWLSGPLVLGVHRGDVQYLRLLRLMGVSRASVNLEMSHLPPAQRTAWHHAFHRFDDDALRMLAGKNRALAAFLDAAGITRIPMEDAIVGLIAGEAHLLSVDHHHVVAAIHVGRVRRLVLAAQAIGDDGGEPSQHHAISVDEQPFLFDISGLCRVGLHGSGSEMRRRSM